MPTYAHGSVTICVSCAPDCWRIVGASDALAGEKNELHFSEGLNAFPWGPLLAPGGHTLEMHSVSVLRFQVLGTTANLIHAAFLLDRRSHGTVEGRVRFLWLSGFLYLLVFLPLLSTLTRETRWTSPLWAFPWGPPPFLFNFLGVPLLFFLILFHLLILLCARARVCGVSICVEKWLSR